MANIELFDKYINGELSDSERNEFKGRLESDKEFATDFNIYMISVIGICKETEQDNMDFGVAMKRLSKEQLRNIVGEPKTAPVIKPKKLLIKSLLWQTASIAAVVAIAFTYSFNVQRQAKYSVYDAIYACADINTDLTRSGGEMVDITKLSDKELEEQLPTLMETYKTSSDEVELADTGYAIAMGYLRLHDAKQAKTILSELVTRFKGNPDFAESVSKWESILGVIK